MCCESAYLENGFFHIVNLCSHIVYVDKHRYTVVLRFLLVIVLLVYCVLCQSSAKVAMLIQGLLALVFTVFCVDRMSKFQP